MMAPVIPQVMSCLSRQNSYIIHSHLDEGSSKGTKNGADSPQRRHSKIFGKFAEIQPASDLAQARKILTRQFSNNLSIGIDALLEQAKDTLTNPGSKKHIDDIDFEVESKEGTVGMRSPLLQKRMARQLSYEHPQLMDLLQNRNLIGQLSGNKRTISNARELSRISSGENLAGFSDEEVLEPKLSITKHQARFQPKTNLNPIIEEQSKELAEYVSKPLQLNLKDIDEIIDEKVEEPAADTEIISELKFLEKEELSLQNSTTIIKNFYKMLIPSLYVSVYCLSFSLNSNVAFYVCSVAESSRVQAAFGLAGFIRSTTISVMEGSVSELMALRCSVAIGAKNFKAIRLYLTQSILALCIFHICMTVPLCFFSQAIFEDIIGVNGELAIESANVLRKLVFVSIVSEGNGMLSTFLYSQGIETISFSLTLGKYAGLLCSSLFFGVYLQWGFNGWIFSMCVFEAIMFFFLMRYYTSLTDPESRGLVSFSEALVGLPTFLKDALTFFAGLIGEWTGWELLTYFNSMTGDENQIIALTCLINLAYFVFGFSYGLMSTARTRINTLIGANLKNAARRFTICSLVAMVSIGMALGLTIFIFRHPIAEAYAGGNPEALRYFIGCLAIYSVVCSLDFIYYLVFSLARTVGLAYWNIGLNILFVISLHSIIGYILNIHNLLSCYTVIINMYSQFFVVFGILIVKICSLDWNGVEGMEGGEGVGIGDDVSVVSYVFSTGKKHAKEKRESESGSPRVGDVKDFKISVSHMRDSIAEKAENTQRQGTLTEMVALPKEATQIISKEKA